MRGIRRFWPRTRLHWLLLALFGGVAAGAALAGFLLFRAQAATTQATEARIMESIAALKVRQITDWRGERDYDASILSTLTSFRDLFAAWHGERNSAQEDNLRGSLRSYLRGKRYSNIVLVDAQGLPLLAAVPEQAFGLCHDTAATVTHAMEAQEVIFGDIQRCGPAGAPQLQVVAPLLGDSADGDALQGAAVFIIDPKEFLYPLLQSWPVPSKTGETLLIRREGDEIVFLNELRHRSDTALKLRLPVTQGALPAAIAAEGKELTLVGRDYRGEEVLAVTRLVPNSNWAMVAKTDTAEVFGELTGIAYRFSFSVILLIGLAGAVVGLVFNKQQSDSLRQINAAQRARETELRTSEEKFRSLFHHLNVGIVVHGADTRILYANPASCRMLGLTEAQIIGRVAANADWHFVQGDGNQMTLAEYPVSQVLASRQPLRDYLLGIVTAAGARPLWVLVDAFPILEAGQLRQIVVTFVDITERQLAQAERARLLRELQLKNKDLENVVYVASHDLRSPLVNIQGFGQRLQTDIHKLSVAVAESTDLEGLRALTTPLLAERIPAAMRFISVSATKMDALINGLLRLSRAAGRAELHPARVDMNETVTAILTAHAYQLEKAGAQLQVDNLPDCWGDAAQINQVFSNLLDNAIKYRDPSRPLHIQISGESRRERTLYRVADTGLGILPDHQERIWEVFHRLDPDGATPGEGLGLTLTRRIVERQNGKIWVESLPGAGSQFFVELPADEQQASLSTEGTDHR